MNNIWNSQILFLYLYNLKEKSYGKTTLNKQHLSSS